MSSASPWLRKIGSIKGEDGKLSLRWDSLTGELQMTVKGQTITLERDDVAELREKIDRYMKKSRDL